MSGTSKSTINELLEPGCQLPWAESYDAIIPLLSIAISLKRIADHLVPPPSSGDMPPLLWLADVLERMK